MRTATLAAIVLTLVACTNEDNFDDKYEKAYCNRSEECNAEQECEPDEEEEDDTGESEGESDYVFDSEKANECLSNFKEAECLDFFGATVVIPPDECFDVYQRAE